MSEMERLEIPRLRLAVKFKNRDQLEKSSKTIISICENHVLRQTTTIQDIIQICAQNTGSQYFSDQIITFCNQIISETLKTSHSIINICKSFSHVNLLPVNTKNTDNSNSNNVDDIVKDSSLASTDEITETPHKVKQENDEQFFQSIKQKSRKSSHLKLLSRIDNNNGETFPELSSTELKTSHNCELRSSHESTKKLDNQNKYLDKLSESVSHDNTDQQCDNVSDQEDLLDGCNVNIKECEKEQNVVPDFKLKVTKTKTRKYKLRKFCKKPKEVYHCSVCQRKFTTKTGFERHELFHERGGKNKYFECKICGYKNLYQSEFANHLRTHTGERPFVCEICGNAYALMSTLRGHQLCHLDYKPESCDMCLYQCRSRKELKQHKTIHSSEKKYQCDECGKSFARASYLKTHSRSHTNDYPFPCQICPKRFRFRNHLRRHETIHKGEMKYSCSICGKQSRQKYNITVHMRTHLDVKPYSCDLCGRKFTYNLLLRQHHVNCDGCDEVLSDTTLNS